MRGHDPGAQAPRRRHGGQGEARRGDRRLENRPGGGAGGERPAQADADEPRRDHRSAQERPRGAGRRAEEPGGLVVRGARRPRAPDQGAPRGDAAQPGALREHPDPVPGPVRGVQGQEYPYVI